MTVEDIVGPPSSADRAEAAAETLGRWLNNDGDVVHLIRELAAILDVELTKEFEL